MPGGIAELSAPRQASGWSWIGSTFAGLEVFGKISAFLSIGAFGRWVTEDWIPFTRKCWTLLVDALPIPNLHLTLEEKDALTAVVFFTPAALLSLFRPAPRPSTSSNAKLSDIIHRFVISQPVILALSLLILYLVARQSLHDAWALAQGYVERRPPAQTQNAAANDFTTSLSAASQWVAEHPLAAGLSVLAVLLALLFFVISLWSAPKLDPRAAEAEHTAHDAQDYSGPPPFVVNPKTAKLHSAMTLPAFSVFAVSLSGVWFAALEIGAVRTVAVALIACAMLITVYRHPFRIVQISVCVLAFIVAAYVLEAGQAILTAIQTTDPNA